MVDVGFKGSGPRGALYDKDKGIDLVGTRAVHFNDFGCELTHDLIYVALVEASVSETSSVDDINVEPLAILFP